MGWTIWDLNLVGGGGAREFSLLQIVQILGPPNEQRGLFRNESVQGMELTSDLYLVPRLGMSGAVPLLTHMPLLR